MGTDSRWQDVIAVEELERMGFHADDIVAFIGDGAGPYLARLGGTTNRDGD